MHAAQVAPTPRLRPGMLIAGRWAVGEVLGRGRHAVVYRAAHVELRYRVALKLFEPDAASPEREQTAARARFEHEVRVATRVEHPNVVRVLESGESDGLPFLVEEIVEGESLEQRLERELLTVAQAVDLGVQVLAGLCGLEAHGIVHCDLRPANVMLATHSVEVVVKICDLGLARDEEGVPPPDPRHPSEWVLGSPRYLAPEQVRSFGVDARCDIHALGTLLYEALAGRAPARGSHPDEILASILRDEPPPLREERHDCPAQLERVILRALAKRPGERFPSADAMQRALRRVARELHLATGGLAWRAPGIRRREALTRPARGPREASAPR